MRRGEPMLARLGNVIYWACRGVTAPWAVIAADDRGLFAATQTPKSSPRRSAEKHVWFTSTGRGRVPRSRNSTVLGTNGQGGHARTPSKCIHYSD
jgi:hypothetical protein